MAKKKNNRNKKPAALKVRCESYKAKLGTQVHKSAKDYNRRAGKMACKNYIPDQPSLLIQTTKKRNLNVPLFLFILLILAKK